MKMQKYLKHCIQTLQATALDILIFLNNLTCVYYNSYAKYIM